MEIMRSKNDYWDILEQSYLAHYGVQGMHWGIRRYQPYSQVPRQSGKGGKEIDAAKIARSSAKEVFDSLTDKEKSNISTSKTFKESPTLITRTAVHDKKGHAKGYAELEFDPDDRSIGYISVAVNPKYRGQGLAERLCVDILNGASNRGDLKYIYWETSKDNKASAALAKKIRI